MADIENVRSKSTEQHKLLRKDTIHVLGTEVLRNDKDHLYAIVFPIRVPGENDEQFNEIVPDAEERWKELFPTEADDPLDKMKASTGVTWETFTREVRENVVKYIGWLGCEVTEFKSVDEDEIFVLFGMKDQKNLKKFLVEEEARVRMKPEAYEWHKFQCPTDKKVGKDFVREIETDHYTLRGRDHYNDYPAFVRYTPEIDEIVEDVEETEMLRILRHALRKYCRVQLMEQVGVVRLFFPIHKWEELQELYKRGWNDPSKPVYYPKAHMPDHVAEYFGAHVASYFHFYNTLTRWLIIPGLISVIFPFVRVHFGPEKAHWLDSGFGLMMCLWTTIFLAHNKHSLNVKLLKWGMGGNVSAVTIVRKNFKDEKRGTWLETCRGLLHWVLVITFISETIFVSRWIVQYRQQIFDNIDGTTWGMKNVDVAKYFKYLITANIKIVEMVFTPLSIYLSKHENHRTEMDLKNAMILKLFAVKFVLFYYPFIRPIFIQPMVEGCPGAGAKAGDNFEGCINDLRQDLQIFFVTQVVSAVGGLLASVGLMFWTIRKEVKRKKSSESLLSYVEVQAMLSDYDEAAEVSDYMQAVLNFGFLSMFGAIAPSMCFLCFLSNLPMKRLLAYRFSYVQKRVIPIITVGIGSWALILNFLAFFGVTSTSFIVIFAFDILDLQGGDKWQSMCIMMMFFFSIERALGVLKFVIDIGSGEKSLSHLRIEECNDDVRDIILANQIKKVSATPRGAGAVVAALAVDQRLQLSHDAWLAMKLVPILVGGKLRMGRDSYSIADLWQESVQRFGDRTFTIFEHRRLSFQDFEHISNQMAHFLLKQGLKTGQVCALMMENKPEYVCWWLAMAKIGVQAAMLNFNLTGKGLAHCIAVAGCGTLVFDAGTEANLHTIDSQIRETGLQLVCWGGKPHLSFSNTPAVVDYDQLMGFPYQGSNFVDLRKGIKFTDVFGYIYTSGTTGLPKAAKVTHARMYGLGGIGRLLGLGPGDVLYTCLPLYHTAGGGLGAMSCFMSGATMALAKKFSAARFWREISEQQCTAFQYIGELGRYLVNYARDHPEVCEIPHKLRGAIGNGLRPEVWDEFQDKFNIPVVVEFYGATEGNGALVNVCRKSDLQQRGAVGRSGFGFDLITGFKIVKFDVENETPVRGANGFCMEAAMDEPGELLFPIREDHPSKRFDGYTDPKATEKKVLRDVFKKGDSWFRSGDLLYKDAKGLWHFVDRIGDTFRWKGENVSTMEVSQVLSSLPGVEEANVYGVQVPGEADGRACMVALRGQDLQSREKLDALQSLCEKELPSYARPRFLRFLSDMDITGTFKHQKVQLRDQGFDPAKVPDPVYILHPESKRYEPLDPQVISQLQQGRSKL